jgi:DNA replication and repair protein RecF
MILKHFSLSNFRTFSRLDTDLPSGMLVLVGANAQGKTSILEAIFYLATFSSFHAQNDRQLINFLALNDSPPVARIVAEIDRGGQSHKLEVRLILDKTVTGVTRFKKEILLDGVRKNAHSALGIFNAVIFLPQMTRIVENSPEERRRYLNLAISQVVPGYAKHLSAYARALEQRNALLKILAERGGDHHQLDYWDDHVAEAGAELIFWRSQAIFELNSIANQIYQKISHGAEDLTLRYDPSFKLGESRKIHPNEISGLEKETPFSTVEEIKIGFREKLSHLQRDEITRGVTTLGPHRDELRFFSNGIDLGSYGSRGQIRSLLLALKLAEVAWMKNKTGSYPVLLLDETQAELDLQRRAELLDYLKDHEQAVFTTTDLALYPDNFIQQSTIWQIASGQIDKSPSH